MDVYSRRIAGQKHDDITIYTKAEADERGISYKHWREANIGGWAITDDEYVGFYYGRYDFPKRGDDTKKRRERYVSYFGFGNLMCSRVKPYAYSTRKATGRFQSDKSWNQALASLRISKMCVKIYVKTLLQDGKVDWATLGRILGPKDEKPEWKARRVFKTQEFKAMVEDELDKALTKKGIDKDYVLSIYERAIALAESNEDPGNMLKAAGDLGKLVGLAPKVTNVTESWQIEGTSKQMEDGMLLAEQSVRLLQQTKKESHDSLTIRSLDGEITDAREVDSREETP
jgi:hypothetical protein